MHDDPRFRARFWNKVQKTDGCWIWTGYIATNGYGRLHGTRSVGVLYAHRVSYEMHAGPIPDGLCVCHHCDNRACVRPDHFFTGTHADNANDKARKGRTVNPLTDANRKKRHCPKGHPYDEVNTFWREGPGGGWGRACRACMRMWQRKGAKPREPRPVRSVPR